MPGPISVLYSVRPKAPVALLAASSAVAVLFVATPFLIPEISARYGVSEGTAGSISVAQVGAFAAATFLIPRLVAPSGALLRAAAAGLVVCNLLSALPDVFWVLVALRALAGAAAGILTWIMWTDAMRSRTTMAGIAAAGPLTSLLSSPAIAAVSGWGDRAVYVALGLAAVPAVLTRCDISGQRRSRGGVSRSRSNRVLLAALSLFTFFSSSLAVNLVIVGRDVHGLSALATSIAFSLDAAAALLGARLSVRHRRPGAWLTSAGVAATLTVLGPAPFFFIGMAWWGFAFWMGVPGVLEMLAARSLDPAERAGDAQGLMAVGRSLGPAMGAAFVDAGALSALAWVSGAGLTAAGATVSAVKGGRSRLPPTDQRIPQDPASER